MKRLNLGSQGEFKLEKLCVRPLEGKIAGPWGVRHVHPKAMDVLICLTERAGEVVRRHEILDSVWGHRHGSDKALTRCVSELRRALDDRDRKHRIIETLPKRGYRIVAPVAALQMGDSIPSRSNRVTNPNRIEAYEYVVRGRELAWLHRRETRGQAARLLAQAISIDPSYAPAYSWLAFVHIIDYVNQWSDAPDESIGVADELAKKAIKLDNGDAQAHFVLGECELWGKRRHDLALAHGRRAAELQPNYSHAYLLIGHSMHYAGGSLESLEAYGAALSLDPCFPDLYLHFLAQSYYSVGRYDAAAEALQQRLARNPKSDISHALLAACYGRLGMLREAASSWAELLAINPDYSLEGKRRLLPYKNPAEFDSFAGGLRAANLLH